jgi:DNA-binding CsgD family transcriptional regulator
MKGGTKIICQAQLGEMWRAGRPVAEIAERFGVTGQAVSNLAKKLGLKQRLVREIDDEEFKALWAEGLTHGSLAGHFGIPIGSVSNHQRRLNLAPRRHYEKPAKPAPVAVEPQPVVAQTRDIRRAENRIGKMEPHPFWTPERDLLVIGTHGKHIQIALLAAMLKRPTADVQKRWHMLRAS